MLHAVIDPVSNRADWVDQCEVRNQSNTLVDLTDATIVLAVREKQTKANRLLATTDDGSITIDGTGVFGFSFSVDLMRGMDASRAYEVGCTIQLNGVTQQFFIGTVSVLDGIVP